MTSFIRATVVPLAAAVAGVLLPAGCERSREPAANLQAPLPSVTVAYPIRQEVMEWDEYTGRLAAVEAVEVRARVTGVVVAAPFAEGALVKAGDTLFEIDPRPFAAELENRQAEVARAESQVQLAQIEYDRISGMPMEVRTPSEYDTVAATLQQAKAVAAGAKAQLELARLNLEWTRVTAPISGRVSRRYVTAGNLISGGGAEATLLTTIASIDPIYCYIDVDEQSMLKYQRLAQEDKRPTARMTRLPAYLQLSNETGFPHAGEIDFVDNRLDPATGTIRARGVFSNEGGWLTPGSFARMRIPGSGRYEALLVPDEAVTTDQNQKNLLVVNAENQVEVRHVQLGALFGDLRAIASGVGPQDRVIINGLMQARPGAKVEPQPAQIPAAAVPLTNAISGPPPRGGAPDALGAPATR